MKNNKILAYALIVSIIAHSVLIVFLLKYDNHKKNKKHHAYSQPVIVEPYKFIKNLEKFKIKKPKYAGIKPHFAKKNTRLNAPYSSNNAHESAPLAPPAFFQKRFADNNKNITNFRKNRRVLADSHILSKQKQNRPRRTYRLSNLYPMGKEFSEQNPSPNESGIKNPSHGVKSATVNLNTTTIKYASYLLGVKNKIENVWEYPGEDRRKGISGELVIKFSINKNGSIYRVKILRSSGKKTLDKAAVKAIQNAARYNPFPKTWTINRLNIVGTFIYRLSDFYLY